MSDSMRVDLADRRALVTGGGTGIGRAISLGLARCGAAVVVNYSRSEREAEETVAAIRASGGRALAVRADDHGRSLPGPDTTLQNDAL